MVTKCLIVDDEPLAIEVIENYLNKIPDFRIMAKCSSPLESIDILRKHNIELMFLDIQMPEISGLDFLKTLDNPPKVIITTAHRKYALEGYELNVVDYLLKPISFERFLKAINKFYSQLSDSSVKVTNGFSDHNNEQAYLNVKDNKKIVKIYLNKILFIEGMKDYVVVNTIKESVITKSTLSNIQSKLPDNMFLRIHKSYIVSIPQVTAFTSYSVEIGAKELTIGRTYKNNVLKTLKYSSGGI
ncbi:MAG: response regulator transcription factor [Melioribacteraceae bacterium]|nr:response regulator transcription factor [Melioribacteraceae bacterium]